MQVPNQQWIKFKTTKSELQLRHWLLVYIKDFIHPPFINLLIRIKLSQLNLELFINDVSLGTPIVIPPAFRMCNWPQSFRFYDPVMAILKQKTTNYTKTLFEMKKQMNIKSLVDDNLAIRLINNYGIPKDKLSYSSRKLTQNLEINYNESKHCSDLQHG